MMHRAPPPVQPHIYYQKAKYCAKCSYPIENEMATLDTRMYHLDCFRCFQCREPLAGKKALFHDCNLYDEECYLLFGANKCNICYKPITGENEQYIKAKGNTYHYDCYVCSQCGSSLSGRRYHVDNDRRICQVCVSHNRLNPPMSEEL